MYNFLGDYQINKSQPGDPRKAALAICDVVRGEGMAQNKPWSPSILLGTDCYHAVKKDLQQMLSTMNVWTDLTKSTDYNQKEIPEFSQSSFQFKSQILVALGIAASILATLWATS
jgi:hypothetical protein